MLVFFYLTLKFHCSKNSKPNFNLKNNFITYINTNNIRAKAKNTRLNKFIIVQSIVKSLKIMYNTSTIRVYIKTTFKK